MTQTDGFLARLDAVEERLGALAILEAAPALTDPDQPSGERWDWGQVWAHVAEFPGYWIRELRSALGTPGEDPPPFGRVKTDPERVGAIERDRHLPAMDLFARTQPDIEDLRALLREMSPLDWERRVSHQTLGVMDMSRVLDEFLIGHLEQHADQLKALAAQR